MFEEPQRLIKSYILAHYLKFAINREIKGESSKVKREQMSLAVIEAGVRCAKAVLHLLDRGRYFRWIEAHATENI